MYLAAGTALVILTIELGRTIRRRRTELPKSAIQTLNASGGVKDVPLTGVPGYPLKASRRSERERIVSDGTIVSSKLLGDMEVDLELKDRIATPASCAATL